MNVTGSKTLGDSYGEEYPEVFNDLDLILSEFFHLNESVAPVQHRPR